MYYPYLGADNNFDKQPDHPVLHMPATSSKIHSVRGKAGSLTKPKWKIKMSKNSHTKESKPALLGGRNPLIASTLPLASICLHLRKPNSWAPHSCGEERKCVPSAWMAAAGRNQGQKVYKQG